MSPNRDMSRYQSSETHALARGRVHAGGVQILYVLSSITKKGWKIPARTFYTSILVYWCKFIFTLVLYYTKGFLSEEVFYFSFYFFIVFQPFDSLIAAEPGHLALGIVFFGLDNFFNKFSFVYFILKI